jgi:hypothetical protein
MMTDTNKVNKIHLLARLFLAVAAVSLTVSAGWAHHGWSWAVDEQSTLEGTIKDVSMAPPHPSLHVTDAGGAVWFVEHSNPSQTNRAGFTAASAKPGDIVIVLGNRDKDASKNHMKAVRVTIGGETYDLYPQRIRSK